MGWLRDQRFAQIQVHPVRVNPVTGELTVIRTLRIMLHFTGAGKNEVGDLRKGPAPDGAFEDVFARTLLNATEAQSWRVERQLPVEELSPQALTVDPPAYKVMVDREGIVQLDYTTLQSAGVPVDNLDPRTFKLTNQGTEIAVEIPGEGDGLFESGDTVRFYGQKMDTRFTDTNVYWLTWAGPPVCV